MRWVLFNWLSLGWLFLSMLLAGCASLAPPPAPPAALFADARFAPPSEPIGAHDLFALSTAMRTYLNSSAFTSRLRTKGLQHGLVDALYSKSDLKLEYESTTTRTASQTYAARTGNCLSLVIMTAAFAKELGMPVRFQSVDVDNTWSRTAGLYLSSSHINVSLGERPADAPRGYHPQRVLVVDFIPRDEAARLRTRELEEDDIVALFLNNRAAEALVQGRRDDAYWWARAAVLARPGVASTLNTLGVIYQRHGEPALAERAFQAALVREPENLAVLHNLQPVLVALGRPLEAAALAARIAAVDPTPPYHYFDLGTAALKAGRYDDAVAHFAREVQRAPYNDEFRFWLGVAHLQLEHVRDAREQIALAVDHSTRQDMREVYVAKLAYLRKMAAGTGTHIR
ncbi:Flp pilus assembly protein TadD [Massilia aurea]|uniref:Flp pilus assembly protein TadD n=1 Tax=Massilia aurea TaxID=373040 RepID=A0A7W9X350_9BURK|nr:tetratricopeptide repeat protein [Massilia aurea]MBB6135558.1 Flp pilus assembly protein TadD [Massilia aurea]